MFLLPFAGRWTAGGKMGRDLGWTERFDKRDRARSSYDFVGSFGTLFLNVSLIIQLLIFGLSRGVAFIVQGWCVRTFRSECRVDIECACESEGVSKANVGILYVARYSGINLRFVFRRPLSLSLFE